MKKITFKNNVEPYLSASNLNVMQDNAEEAISQKLSIEDKATETEVIVGTDDSKYTTSNGVKKAIDKALEGYTPSGDSGEVKKNFANAIKLKSNKAKKHTVHCSDSYLQNVEAWGESTQKNRTGKNLLNVSERLTVNVFTEIPVKLKAGDYTLSFTNAIQSADNNLSLFSFGDNQEIKSVYVDTSTAKNVNITLTREATNLRMYAHNSYDNSVGKNKIFEKMMIMAGTYSTLQEYEAYGTSPSTEFPSNVENVKQINVKINGKNALSSLYALQAAFITYNMDPELVTSKMTLSGMVGITASNIIYLQTSVKTFNLGTINIKANERFSITLELTEEMLNAIKSSTFVPRLQLYTGSSTVDYTKAGHKEFMLENGSTVTEYNTYKKEVNTINLPERNRTL